LPEFDRTLSFYKNNSFEIAGGRKLKNCTSDLNFGNTRRPIIYPSGKIIAHDDR
jgi:hypothetical protein